MKWPSIFLGGTFEKKDKQNLACTKIKGYVSFFSQLSTMVRLLTDKEKQNHSGTRCSALSVKEPKRTAVYSNMAVILSHFSLESPSSSQVTFFQQHCDSLPI